MKKTKKKLLVSDTSPKAVEAEVELAPLVKKKKKKVSSEAALFDVNNIMEEMKGYDLEVMGADSQERIPYIIPFSNHALQKITGGIIGGRFVEISGDSQAGKSFLLYDLIQNCLNMGGAVLLDDNEIAFDPAYGRRIGLKPGANFLYTKTNNIKTFFEMARKFSLAVRKKKKSIPILVCVDSFAGLKHPDAIKHAEAGEDKGYEAMQKNAYFSQKLDQFINIIDKYEVTFVLINQTREDHQVQYGDATYTLGENVIKFWCTQRLRGKLGEKDKVVVKSLKAKEKKKQIGVTAIWETIKNRRIEPFQKVEVKVNYSKGMLRYSGLAELLANDGVIVNATKSVPMVDADGNPILDSKKKQKMEKKKVLKVRATGDTYDNIKELVKAHPEFLEPKMIDATDADLDSDTFGDEEEEEYTLND